MSLRTIATTLVLALGCLLATACTTGRPAPEATTYPAGPIMYLIPDDSQEIEPELAPERFIEAGTLPIGATTEWAVIRDMAAEGTLEALVIHHAALDKVEQEQVRQLFNKQGLVVAGIGIPGDELAAFVDRPELYSDTWPPWREGDTYTTSAYFYVYSYWASGSRRASTDSLMPEGATDIFLHLIESHVEGFREEKASGTR